MNFLNSIRSRMTLGSLALTLVPLILSGAGLVYLSINRGGTALSDRTNQQLTAIGKSKEAEVTNYVDGLRRELLSMAVSPTIVNATAGLGAAAASAPTQLALPIGDARAAVRAYYIDAFGPEYDARNPGNTLDFGALADTLTDSAVALQYLYIVGNKQPDRSLMLDAADTSDYSQIHKTLQPYTLALLAQSGFTDINIADTAGNLVYTSAKKPDLGADLVNGSLKSTGMSEAVAKALQATEANYAWLSDYAAYYPAKGEVSTNLAVPIFSNGKVIGALVGQVQIATLSNIMTFNGKWTEVGMGTSGESYLIGRDRTSRSNSRFLVEDQPGFLKTMADAGLNKAMLTQIDATDSNVNTLVLNTVGANAALAGKTGLAEYPDYRNVPVLGYYAPISVLNQKWAMLTEIDVAEERLPVEGLKSELLKYGVPMVIALGLLGLIAALRLTKSISAPIASLNEVVQRVSGGETEARVNSRAKDEIGDLSRAFDGLLDDRVATFQNAARENETLNNSVIEIMMAVGQLAQRDLTVKAPVNGDVTGAVSDAINTFTSETAIALSQVLGISNSVALASNRVKNRSDDVILVAQRSGLEAQSASRELEATAVAISEIAAQAKLADGVAAQAIAATQSAMDIVRHTVNGISVSRDQIRETEKRIKRLGERSQEISGIVGIIDQIAEKTSLLALNASMQAVAAGDAGRGFAVVADEVKRLAENARQATQQIAGLVSSIQTDSSETMRAMNQTIAQVVDISKLAEKAGVEMSNTRNATNTLAQTVREISNTTQQQAAASGILLERAQALESSNLVTRDQLDQQNQETLSLMQYAQNLLETVRVFKLPESDSSRS
jgi:methyl-accepting chemotaxis protein